MKRNDTVVLCSRGKGCCPVVKRTDTGIEITDDYNGKVILTNEEVKLFKNLLKDWEENENLISS